MNAVKRTFMPGSEWLYFKYYTGEKIADYILVEILYPILKQLKKNIIFRNGSF